MTNLTINRFEQIDLPQTVGWLLGECMQALGKQELWMRQRPKTLEALREQAVIQSVESSNRIEGVSIAAERLRPLILEKARPKDRPEEELAGYRKSLEWIFSRKRRVLFGPEVVLKLHSIAQGGMSGDAGCWKSKDNEIIEILPNNERHLRFKPMSAKATPDAMEQLCLMYRHIHDKKHIPILLNIATAVFDLLCIHPFRDGNGRVSRLVATFLLMQESFSVCRFVSLEKAVEDRKEEYYQVLKQCSAGWHEGQNDIVPWWGFFLSTLRNAYKEFAQKVGAKSTAAPKSELARSIISGQVGPFTLSEISTQMPATSRQLVKKVLMRMKKEGLITVSGRGRGAVWELIRKR